MTNPRLTGLSLLLIGVLVLMGNTLNVLPPEAFWAGLLMYPIGGYLFFTGSRAAIDRAETRTARSLNPRLGNRPGQEHAKRQEHGANPNAPRAIMEDDDQADAESRIVPSLRGGLDAKTEQMPAAGSTTAEPLALHDLEEEGTDFAVESDVSFPVEVQERQSLADQLEKLAKLQQEGIISADEYAIAKAKLLG